MLFLDRKAAGRWASEELIPKGAVLAGSSEIIGVPVVGHSSRMGPHFSARCFDSVFKRRARNEFIIREAAQLLIDRMVDL